MTESDLGPIRGETPLPQTILEQNAPKTVRIAAIVG